MKSLLLFWLSVGLLTSAFSQDPQEIDSLRRSFNNSNPQYARRSTEIASRLGWLFYVNGQPDSSLYYYKAALNVPYKNSRSEWLANVYLGIGACYNTLNKLDSSVANYKRSLFLFESLKDSVNIASTFTNLAIVFKNQGLYEEALSHALQAARIFEKQKNKILLASCYNTIGHILSQTKNYNDALRYYKDAIYLIKDLNENSLRARFYNNIGDLFILTHHYDSARINLDRAAQLKLQLNDTKGLARTINNLGKVSMLTGNLNEAAKELGHSLSIQKTIDDPIGMIEVLNNLGELYLLTSDHNKSRSYLLEAEKIIRSAGTPEYLRQNLELQVKVAEVRHDLINGMKLMDELLIIRDSLLNEEKSKSLQVMHIRYETEKKEQQIALLQQQEEIHLAKIRNSQILIAALAIGIFLVAAIGTLIYINLRNAKAAKVRIELLLAETRHRIKNNLQTLASIFHLQTRHYTDHEMVLEARSSESRVHTMSMLHEKLYNADADHVISTRTYITDLVHKLVDVYGIRTRDLHLSLNVDDIELDIDKGLALSLIIQELVCNAFKYAFEHKRDPELTVSITLHGDQVVATVKDNGIGLNDHSIGKSQGFSLVEALVAQLDGQIRHDNSEGTEFVIQFPAAQWKKRLFS